MKFKRLVAFLLSVSMVMGMMPAIVFASETDKDPDEPGTEETAGSGREENSKPQETKPSEPKNTKTEKPEETKPQETEPAAVEPKETVPSESKPTAEKPKDKEPSDPEETAPSESKTAEPAETKETEPPVPEETGSEKQEETIPSASDKKKAGNDGEVTVVDSGECGPSITWSLNSEGVLSITGSGAFYSFNGMSGVPWYDHVKDITEVKFSGAVTSISPYSFTDCEKLKSIDIPDTVTSIGADSFTRCTGLTDFSVPKSVTSIGGSAFNGCKGLTSFTIPENVVDLGEGVFASCTNLAKVKICGKITKIPDFAFRRCGQLADIEIPDSVVSIGDYAFERCASLTDFGVFKNVTSIGKSAFSRCRGLKNIVFPNSQIEIKKGAFEYCDDLSVVINRESYVQEAFASSAKIHFYYTVDDFQNDGKGTIEAVNAVNGKLSTYGTDVVELKVTPVSKYELEKIIWTSGDISKDLYPDENGRIEMPDVDTGSTAVLKACFRLAYDSGDCGNDLQWALDNKGTLTISGSGAMYDWVDAKKVPWYGYRALVKEVVISGNVTSIGINAFFECDKLTRITLPEGVTSIGNSAFSYCGNLTNITIPEGVISIGNSAFCGCGNLTSITIPEGVTSIGNSAFSYCGNLTNITIPEGVTSIGGGAFQNCRSLTSITLPEGVTSIGNSAFYGCGNLTSITLPEGVTSIGILAFYGCRSLTSITIPEGVTSIGKSAFELCGSLKNITIPEGVTSIGQSAFERCEALSGLIFPDKNIAIATNAFKGCTGLTSVVLRESSYSEEAFPGISKSIFHYYYNLAYETDGIGTLTGIKTRTFGTDMIELSIAPNDYAVMEIVNVTFTITGNTPVILNPNPQGKYIMPDSNAEATLKVSFRASYGKCGDDLSWTLDKNGTLTISGSGAMYDWNDANAVPWYDYRALVKEVVISGNVTSIGINAFYDCDKLIRITIPEEVTSIGNSAFYGCGNLTSITIPEGVTSIGESAFCACENLTSITIPEGVTTIGDGAFYGCESLTSLYISKNVTFIGIVAFAGCRKLETIYYSGSKTDWGLHLPYLEIDILYLYNRVVVSTTENGSVTVDKSIAVKDETITITAVPYNGYMIDEIKVNGTVINGNTFKMGEEKAIVTVTFREIPANLNETVTKDGFDYLVTNAKTDGTGTVTLTHCLNQNAAVSVPNTVVLKGVTYRVTRIGSRAFYGNTAIKTVSVGACVTVIDSYAFYGCSNLTKVSGGSRVQTIGSYAFANCAKLSSFTITSSALKKIGYYAFSKDKKLKTIYIKYTTKLSKSGVKKSLKGSSVKTVKVKKSKVKKYKKYFKKSNSGRKVKVKK